MEGIRIAFQKFVNQACRLVRLNVEHIVRSVDILPVAIRFFSFGRRTGAGEASVLIQYDCLISSFSSWLILQADPRWYPGDNQGVRYAALYLLIEVDQDAAAEELYESYSDDGSAWWRFGRALLDFRKSGDTPKARSSLQDAIKYNPYVPQYLLEIKRRPPTPPGHYGIGDENEAMYYYDAAIRAWAHTDDVYDWLLDVSKEFFEKENKKRKR